MKYIACGEELQIPTVELTRRNLMVLLAKLDGHPLDSACTIVDSERRIAVQAVEDAEHYADREPGRMHDDTETALGKSTSAS